jgi:DNA polymerase-3 subunit delta
MEIDQIISEWKKGVIKPVYWLEGEESYYIDKLTDFAEKNLLSEDQQSFNLSIFYGKDAKIEEVLNACRRYPVFSDKQVVIIKEAQQMRDIEKIETYLDSPLLSTILLIAYKEKTLDKRKTFSKSLHKKAVVLTTKKLYDNELPQWVSFIVKQKGLDINPNALQILIDHIGNDLQRMENEIEKVSLNLAGRNIINEDDIEAFVGVSKEFNVFELQKSITSRDLVKSLRIINYFASNPKAGPIQLVLPTLYSFFSKLYVASSSNSRDEKLISSLIGVNFYFARDYVNALQLFSLIEIEKNLLLLHHYNLKSIGINRTDIDDAELMKELAVKIIGQSIN